MRQGEGVYTYFTSNSDEKADTYSGSWVNNAKHGIGKQCYLNVGSYYGYWENGKRHGEGVMNYVNEDIYSGQWANGLKEGKGTYVFLSTGQKFVGTYLKGSMV